MEKFIYVFDEVSRDALIQRGYVLMKEDPRNRIYIFLNDGKGEFGLSESSFALSNILTF